MNGVTSVGTNSPTYMTNTLSNGDQVKCIMTSNAGCVTGNPATSNTITMTVNTVPVITSFDPPGGNTGTIVTITGNGLLNSTAVTFNGINASYTIDNNNQITAVVPAGNTAGQIAVQTGCGTINSSTNFIHVESVSVDITLLIEGFHTGGGQMRGILSPVLSDSIEIALAKAIAPYPLLVSLKKPLDISGHGTFDFPPSFYGDTCYLVVKHRNALQTWSSSPVIFSDTALTYDFTTAASKAFGNNMVNAGGGFAIRSGDVNQDGIIDTVDMELIGASSSLFSVGYIPADLDGDGMAESADYSLVENNLLISISRP
jgi:hypothetical protein